MPVKNLQIRKIVKFFMNTDMMVKIVENNIEYRMTSRLPLVSLMNPKG